MSVKYYYYNDQPSDVRPYKPTATLTERKKEGKRERKKGKVGGREGRKEGERKDRRKN